MKRKNHHQSGGALLSVKLAGAALSLLVVAPSQATVITIDNMTTSQSLISACPGSTPQSSAQAGSGIYGGTRIITANNVQGSGSASQCTNTNVPDSVPPSWNIANPSRVTGNGSIVWSGSANPTGFFGTPLDLEFLQYFNFDYLTADQATTFYIEAWSDNSSCSRAVIDSLAANTSASNVQISKADFSSICTGATQPANFSSIGRLVVFMDAVEALDTEFRGVTAVVGTPPVIGCEGSTINGSTNFQVSDDACHDLTVAFTVSNTGGVSGLVTVLDELPQGMTRTGNVSCTNGLTFGQPGTPQWTWNSTTSLAAGTSSTCTFTAQICSLPDGETRTNAIQVSRTAVDDPVGSCAASVSRNSTPPPPHLPIPTLSEWAQMLMMALMLVNAGWYVRRERMS